MTVVAALYVMKDGPYFFDEGVDPWDESRDARNYAGPHPVVAHPPCERWGRYWGGGPMLHGTPRQKKLGDDGGCFAAALDAVRRFGGVLEHPEASHAFRHFGLPRPSFNGGWTEPDQYGGRSCCVAQGHYGHRAQKMTWLYAVGTDYPELRWGRCAGLTRLEPGYHSKEERARAIKTGICQRLSRRQRLVTPDGFKALLIAIARSARKAGRR